MLKKFNIITQVGNNYNYTAFGYAITKGNKYYAVNDMSHTQDPTTSAIHWSLYILYDILKYFENIFLDHANENKSIFNKDFKKFEDKLWSDLHYLSSQIPNFYLQRNDCNTSDKVGSSEAVCCANKFIISNASITVNLNEGKPCVFNSLASVLDPAGSTTIYMNNNDYEYGNINCFVYGYNKDNNGIQDNVYFNGIIDFLKDNKKNNIYYLRNRSINMIKGFDVQCSIQVDYNYDNTNYNEIKKGAKVAKSVNDIIFEKDFPNVSNKVKVPQNTELSSTRRQMTYTLLNILSSTYGPKYSGVKNITSIDTKSLYDAANEKYVKELFASTLNKTVGDLMQILTSVIKYGGITSFPNFLKDNGFHSSVIGFNSEGNALREINHHDLTASIINLFMLIFGSHTFNMTLKPGGIEYYNNPGKNEGSYMADHRTTFMGFGNTIGINNTITNYNAKYKNNDKCKISDLKIVKIMKFDEFINKETQLQECRDQLQECQDQLQECRDQLQKCQDQPQVLMTEDNRTSSSDISSASSGNVENINGLQVPTMEDNPTIRSENNSSVNLTSTGSSPTPTTPKRPRDDHSENEEPSNNSLLGRFMRLFKRQKGGKTNKNHYIKMHKTSIKSKNKNKQNKKSLKSNKHKKNSNTYKNK